jgi:DNA polymerase-3 subunit beta
VLKKSMDIAKVAMLQDNSRFHLGGIHMHFEQKDGDCELRFVATDLFRVACVGISAPEEVSKMPPIIVSKKAVAEILKLLDSSNVELVNLLVSDSKIAFKLADEEIKTEFSSRLINGVFPEYKCALSVPNDKILIVNTKDFITAIDRVSTVVVDSTSSIKLNIQNNKLTITGASKEFGTAIDEIEATFSSSDQMEICFNSRYLIEILGKIDSKEAKILLGDSDSSAIVVPTEELKQNLRFAIMPIEIVKN